MGGPVPLATLALSLSALLAACSGQGSTLSCGTGTVQQGTSCVATDFCDPGTHLDGGICLADSVDAGPPIACGQGTVLQGATCVPADGDAGPPSTWNASVRVSAPGVALSESPRIAVSSTGDIFIAGMEGSSSGALQSAILWVSRDHGQTFSLLQAQAAPPGASMESTSVVIDSHDRMAWSWSTQEVIGGAVSGAVFASFSNDGRSFGSPTLVSVTDPNNPDCGDAWLSIDRAGTFYLTWVYGSLSNSSFAFGGRFAQTSVASPAFGPPMDFVTIALVSSGFRVIIPAGPLAFDPMGNPVTVVNDDTYDTSGNPTSEFINAVRQRGGVDQTIPLLAPEQGRYFTVRPSPILVSDSKGALTAVLVGGVSRQEQVYVTHSIDGSVWDPPAPLEEGTVGGGAALPWLTVDEQDRVHVFWLDNRSGAWRPYTAFSRDGVRFEASEQVGDQDFAEDGTAGHSIGDHLSLVVRGGQRYAAWTDTREGSSQIRFATSPEPQ